jgi:hypothetical protein
MIPLEAIFKDFLRLLNEKQVEYLVIGGYALSVHGYVRATGDIDIWIHATPQNAEKMMDVMLAFGFSPYDFSEQDFLPDENGKAGFLSFGDAPFKIEILGEAQGVSFTEAYPKRKTVVLDDTTIHFIGLHELIANKKAVGRPKDLLDIENLPQEE